VWLCRPGIPFLLEINQVADARDSVQNDVIIALPLPVATAPDSFDFIPQVSIRLVDSPYLTIRFSGLKFTICP
jgi:hypothetical protein